MPWPNRRAWFSRSTRLASITGVSGETRRMRSRLSSRRAHSSYICDGASTKSRCTLVPAWKLNSVSDSTPCSMWPNSWNSVSTSSWVRPRRSKFVTSTLIGVRLARVLTPRTGQAAACLNLPSRG